MMTLLKMYSKNDDNSRLVFETEEEVVTATLSSSLPSSSSLSWSSLSLIFLVLDSHVMVYLSSC